MRTPRPYARLHNLAEEALRAGQAVIVDATHQRPEERAAIAVLAARAGAPFFGFWLEAPIEILTRRVSGRLGDASDATAAVVAAQAKDTVGTLAWRQLDASQSLKMLKSTALGLVQPFETQPLD